MKDDNVITVMNPDGVFEKIEVLQFFKFKNDDKKYIIYKYYDDKQKNENLIFSAEVIENEDSILLDAITDKDIVEKMKQLMEEMYSEWNRKIRYLWVEKEK